MPSVMRKLLGIKAGSRIGFELRGGEIVIVTTKPMSAHCGMLRGYDLGDVEPEKEPDRTF